MEINGVNGNGKVFYQLELKQTEVKSEENAPSVLELGGGVDTVSFSTQTNQSETFADVKAEMDKNVPDRTTTIEEKELAIKYIDRMLACDDITPELKEYWTEKKNEIEKEIQEIKAMTAADTAEVTDAPVSDDIEAQIEADFEALDSLTDKCRQDIERAMESVKAEIAHVDNLIADVEKKLDNFFYKLFSGNSLKRELNDLEQRKAELEEKLEALNAKLQSLNSSDNVEAAESKLMVVVDKYGQKLDDEIASLKGAIEDIDREIESEPTRLRGLNTRRIRTLRQQKAELQAKLDKLIEERGLVDAAKETEGDVKTAALVYLADKYGQRLDDEAAGLSEQIAYLDNRIANVEKKLPSWYSFFLGDSIQRELDDLNKQKAELQAKLDEINKERANVDSAKETATSQVLAESSDEATNSDEVREIVDIIVHKDELKKEKAEIEQQIAYLDNRIANVEKKLSSWFYSVFLGDSLQRELDDLKQQRAELQARADEIQSKLDRISSTNIFAQTADDTSRLDDIQIEPDLWGIAPNSSSADTTSIDSISDFLRGW